MICFSLSSSRVAAMGTLGCGDRRASIAVSSLPSLAAVIGWRHWPASASARDLVIAGGSRDAPSRHGPILGSIFLASTDDVPVRWASIDRARWPWSLSLGGLLT